MMCYRQPIRNTASPKETKPRVFDALIDGDDVYLEVKNAKERELIRLRDVLAQIEDGMVAGARGCAEQKDLLPNQV